jgi:hypothetical protein
VASHQLHCLLEAITHLTRLSAATATRCVPVRADNHGRVRSLTGVDARKTQVSGGAGQRRSVVPTSQAGSGFECEDHFGVRRSDASMAESSRAKGKAGPGRDGCHPLSRPRAMAAVTVLGRIEQLGRTSQLLG